MISIIIPNYNGKHHLKTCFDSLRNQSFRDFEIILVDNASSDDSINFTNENYSEVRIIKLNYNTGFAKAVNEGIKRSNSEFILLLNNDTECDREFLTEMMKGVVEETVGSVACKMLNFDDRNFIDDAGDFIKLKGSPYARGYEERDIGQYNDSGFIFGACAGAALYRRKIFDEIGFFDEDFFAYYEDVDLSFRMQLSGYKCFYNPKAVCYHKRGSTSGAKSGFQTMLCEKNLIAVRIKNYPAALFFKCLPYFMFVRVKRYYIFLTRHSFELFACAVKGFFKGLIEIPKSLKKRRAVQKNRKVSIEYLADLLK